MYTTLIFNDDLREKIFSKYYLFGRIAIIPNPTYIDIFENTETYKYVLENGINAYDYYLNNK